MTVSFHRPRVNDLATALRDRRQRGERTLRPTPRLFLELPLRSRQRFLAGRKLPLGNRPRSLILLRPKGSARMHQKNLRLSVLDAKHQETCTLLRHRVIPPPILTRTWSRSARWLEPVIEPPNLPNATRAGFTAGARYPQHGFQAALDIVVGRRPRGDADAHGGASLPDGRACPTGAVRLNARDHPAGHLGVAERDQDLIDHHVVEDLVPPRLQALGEARRMAARALDQVGQPLPSQRAQRGPYLDAARPPREFRRVVLGFAGFTD